MTAPDTPRRGALRAVGNLGQAYSAARIRETHAESRGRWELGVIAHGEALDVRATMFDLIAHYRKG